jgi:hypothetical protein
MVAQKRHGEAKFGYSGAARCLTVGCRKGDGGDEGGSGNGGGALIWTVARRPVERSLGFKPACGTRRRPVLSRAAIGRRKRPTLQLNQRAPAKGFS